MKTETLNRLRASENRLEERAYRDRTDGNCWGERWAEEVAEFDELGRVADAKAQETADLDALWRLIDPRGEKDRDAFVIGFLRIEEGEPSEHFIRGFKQGAREVFNEYNSLKAKL